MLTKRRYKINMPQMVLSGISENWLFREIGDLHWSIICDGLGSDSHEMRDELGNRLYATFVRVRIVSNVNLQNFKENDTINMTSESVRFGKSIYFSDVGIISDLKHIEASLMTTFTLREGSDNQKLTKSQPCNIKNNRIRNSETIPIFCKESMLMRKHENYKLSLSNEDFNIVEDYIYENGYKINPFLDLNGVNLLYFASYPTISDYCEAEYFNSSKSVNNRWELGTSTIARDIFYYGNCNISDSLIYRLHNFENIDEDKVKLNSSLMRKSDGKKIAQIFTIKEFVRS